MSTQPVARAFASAVAAMVGEPDVADVLHHLVSDCATVLEADAVAILARGTDGELSLLSATSHGVAELEMLQAQRDEGPCVDAIARSEAVSAAGVDQLTARWHDVGRAITDAGFASVDAFPLRWRGAALGGLNVFWETPSGRHRDPTVGQAFADVAMLAIIRSIPVSTEQALAHLHDALSARAVVEQAKGVLAHVDDLDMSAAYDALVRCAEESGETLTQAARRVVGAQHREP